MSASEIRKPWRPYLPPALHALLVVLATERLCLAALPMATGSWLTDRYAAFATLYLLGMAGLLVIAMRARLGASAPSGGHAPQEPSSQPQEPSRPNQDLPRPPQEPPRFAPLALLLVLSALVGTLVSLAYLTHGARFCQAMAREPISQWRIVVTSDAAESRFGFRCRAHATKAGQPGGDVTLALDQPADFGDVLEVYGRFEQNGDDEWGRRARSQGIWGTVHVVYEKGRSKPSGLRGAAVFIRRQALQTINPDSSDGRALLAGSVCGDRRAMDARGLDDLFSLCGVAHLVAVSGGHIAVIAALVAGFAERLHLRPPLRAGLTLGLSGLFVLCCGAPASAVRSWAMTGVGYGAQLAGRRSHALSSVCLVALVMALVDPGATGQLGFLLSVASVAGLATFSPYMNYALEVLAPMPPLPRGLPYKVRTKALDQLASLRSTLAATLVCQAVTLPFVLPLFAQLSLVAPLANVLLGIPFAWLVSLGSLAAALAWAPPLAAALLVPCDLLSDLSLAILRQLARIPLASIPLSADQLTSSIITLGLMVALLMAWPDLRREDLLRSTAAILLGAALIVARWRYLVPPRVVVLDVGQGDAILIQDGPAAMLVDTGVEGSLAPALAREHVLHLDAVALTHMHDDHTGGVADLVGTLSCDRVLVGEGVSSAMPRELAGEASRLTGGSAQELRYGDVLHVGGFELRVVWPYGPSAGDTNADSLEMSLSYRRGGCGLTALLTGDAEEDQTSQVIAAGDAGDIDFLKVGHHGSEVSLDPASAAALSPEVAVASAGEGNEYGHPRPACIHVLTQAGATFLCTIQCGDVTVEPGRDGPVVTTSRPLVALTAP